MTVRKVQLGRTGAPDPSTAPAPQDPSTGREKCTGKANHGGRCKNWPIRGGRVCGAHGGKAPQVKAAAARRLAEDRIRRGLADFDITPIADPLTELAQLAGEVVGWKDALRARVNEITGARAERHDAEDDGVRYTSDIGTEQLRAEVALFERAMDRCAAVLGMIAKLNIDERLARITEAQADVVIAAIQIALDTAGVTGEPLLAARNAAARHLRVAS